VIIDALAKRKKFFPAAEAIFLMIADADNDIKGFVTANSITDIYYVLREYIKSKDDRREILEKLMDLIAVLDVNAADCSSAVSSVMDDFEDAVLESCAFRHKIDVIISRDTKGFVDARLPSMTPSEFIEKESGKAIDIK
jgi:predicted nucleic acid-binding protein